MCDRKDELKHDLIFQRIQAASGTLRRDGDAKSAPSPSTAPVRLLLKPALMKLQILIMTSSQRGQPKGVTSFVPTGNANSKFADEDGIKQAIKAVRADSDPTDWLILGYVNKSQIGLLKTGQNIQACFDMLDNSQVQYAFFRIADTVDKTTQYRVRTLFCIPACFVVAHFCTSSLCI